MKFDEKKVQEVCSKLNAMYASYFPARRQRKQSEYFCKQCNSIIPYKNFAKIAKHLQDHKKLQELERKF